MRGYNNLDYFRELDFIESLNCYIHLLHDLQNELTVETVTMMLKAAFSPGGEPTLDENIVDSFVEEFF